MYGVVFYSHEMKFQFRLQQYIIVNRTSGIETTEGVPFTPYVWQFWAAVLDSSGILTDSGQALGDSNTRSLASGDLVADDNADAFAANMSDQPNRVCLNDDGTHSERIGWPSVHCEAMQSPWVTWSAMGILMPSWPIAGPRPTESGSTMGIGASLRTDRRWVTKTP